MRRRNLIIENLPERLLVSDTDEGKTITRRIKDLGQLAEAYRYGLSVKQIVDIFTTKTQFTDVYPTSLSHEALGLELANQIIKNSATVQAKAEAAARRQAEKRQAKAKAGAAA